jgi:transcriptional regulator with XRE-family HTH domain
MSPEQPSNKIGKSVGEKLRAARIAQHYTQSQLAAPDFSVSYISAIERGQIHPSLRALEILAARLGLSSTQLLPTRSQQEEQLSASSSITERDDNEIELLLLEAQIQIRQGNTEQAIAQLEQLSPKGLKGLQLLQYYYLLGYAYYRQAQYQECDYIITGSIPLTKDLQANYLYERILNLQALAQAAMRNYAQAIQTHQQCLEALNARQPADPFFTAQVYIAMGQHYNQLENYPQALEMFHKALALTEKIATSEGMHAAYLHMSQEYTRQNEYMLATLYLHKSMQLHYWEKSKHLKSTLYYFIGQALLQHNPTALPAFLQETLQKEAYSHDYLSQACLNGCFAAWYLKQQQLDEAERYAQQACNQAHTADDNLIRANILITYGHIKYGQRQIDEGDKHFIDGLAMLERLGYHEELAHEAARYAELLEQAGKVHEAFTYFRRAFQSQQLLGK